MNKMARLQVAFCMLFNYCTLAQDIPIPDIQPYWSGPGDTIGTSRHVLTCENKIKSLPKSAVPVESTIFEATGDCTDSKISDSEDRTGQATDACHSSKSSSGACEPTQNCDFFTDSGAHHDPKAESAINVCPEEFTAGPEGKHCYRAVLSSKTWHESKNACEAWESNLASIISEKEMAFIWENILHRDSFHFWIGLYKHARTNTSTDGWKWIDGTEFDTNWTIWKMGQPRTDDKYVIMNYARNEPHWLGNEKGIIRNAFICKHHVTNLNKSKYYLQKP